VIIDCHGHVSAPAQLWAYKAGLLASRGAHGRGGVKVSDDEMLAALNAAEIGPKGHLEAMRSHGTDVQLISPRPFQLMHSEKPAKLVHWFAEECHNIIHRQTKMFPGMFFGVASLPQVAGDPVERALPELERCVKELGFIGCNLNPDPSGGYFNSPPLTDKWWYPFYEKMVELDVPAMIHVSGCCNPAMHTTGSYYLNADTMAFMQLILSDVFKDFPTLKLIIPHGGGAVPFHWGRFRGLALNNGRPELDEIIKNNIFFDTCVYHQPGINLLTEVVPVENILFASEMVGAVKGVDPKTGFNFDDTKRYIDHAPRLSDADRAKIFEGNARRVYGRLGAALKAAV
jgi:4-oxalmesaconate hydratase